ncbi:hypothetical protein [Persicitalea jodogahamensis]|uniref:Uncharacterized protein n=1 Tax=Persicitalea jodogahamensis TaxID=402147 RepID=A0A8J3D3T4_9BACT|nr:hypothetical protein [Persicitalea jodogahamensis]GHB70114.1 hypothetical protein GCM10007390_24670 [Persicitalea jodogahamensis]
MRKLSTLVLLAFLAAPALSLAATGPADTAPKTNVVWIALGNTPMAVEAAPAAHLVTICYYGVTMMVSEKIAKRYLRIGARCGSCDMEDYTRTLLPSGGYLVEGSVCKEPCGGNLLTSDVDPCDDTRLIPIEAPASTEKVIQIGK